MGTAIRLYQIAYDQASLKQVLDSDFLLLDNLENPRPDWYEYWPIRKFLTENTLDENSWYGFFSPKFSAKTQLGHAQVCDFIHQSSASSGVSVALFSPQPDMGAHFLNVFEQAEVFDPGFIDVAAAFLATQGISVPLTDIVMDSRQVVFSNYFVAKPVFWRLWFVLAEALFKAAEDPQNPLYTGLNHATNYSANAPRKVFLSERLASLLLSLHPEMVTAVANPFNFGWSMSRFREQLEQSYINDALKRAYRDTGFPQYMDAFRILRQKFVAQTGVDSQ